MKKQTTILIISGLTLAVILIIGFIFFKPKPIAKAPFVPKSGKVENIEFILIKNAFGYGKTDILKPNAAVLITNKKEIIEDQQLFLAPKEHNMMSGDGYDYYIQFWTNSDNLAHNVGIDEFTSFSYKQNESYKQLRSYTYQLEKAPTHYIYNLKVSTSLTPSQVKASFKNTGLKVLFINDTLFRSPEVCFSIKHIVIAGKNATDEELDKAEKENSRITENIFKNICSRVKSVADVIHQSDVFYDYYGGDGKTYSEIHGSVSLYFKRGVNKDIVSQLIKNEGAKLEYFNTPDYYKVQLVDPQSDIDVVRKQIKKYKFVKEVSAYSDPYKN